MLESSGPSKAQDAFRRNNHIVQMAFGNDGSGSPHAFFGGLKISLPFRAAVPVDS